ncbi:MAG: EFR1 family ferrodoxin [Planctomycetia bacterium]|nr:EFR1 family ferrodoxin [Planctomycetia bacterium]
MCTSDTLNTLRLYWFSGSGNTLIVARAFAERLRDLGWKVELWPMECFFAEPPVEDALNGDSFAVTRQKEWCRKMAVLDSDYSKSAPHDTVCTESAFQKISHEIIISDTSFVGFAFPTHCFSVPERVKVFIDSLPNVHGTPALMLGTHGLFSGGVMGPLKRRLKKKGFCCVGARIISMPDSFFPFFSERFNRNSRHKAVHDAQHYAEDIHAGNISWRRWPIFSDIFGWIFAALFSSRRFFRPFHSTVRRRKKSCISCGSCVRFCPVSAIKMDSQGVPTKADSRCINCLRCVAVCPTDAVRHLCFSPYRVQESSLLQKDFEMSLSETSTHPVSTTRSDIF